MAQSPAKEPEPIILVVEEEEGIRNLLKLALSMSGFQVLLAGSGAEAIDLCLNQNQHVDLILMDVRMREMDGPETFTTLQKSKKDIRCCFMSGDTSLERTNELVAQGALHVSRKPFQSLQEIVGELRGF